MDDLTDFERTFVSVYMTNGFKGAAAARAAGTTSKYPEKIAFDMLRRPAIRALVDAEKQRLIDENAVSPGYVLEKIVKIVEKTSDEEDKKNYSPTAALRGLELLAKHLGMFIDRTEISGKDGEAINMKVQEDNDALQSAIASLTARARKSRVAEEPDERTESAA